MQRSCAQLLTSAGCTFSSFPFSLISQHFEGFKEAYLFDFEASGHVCGHAIRAILLIFAVFCCFTVSKPRFITPDGINITLGYNDMGSAGESYIYGSLHSVNTLHTKRLNSCRSRSSYFLLLLLLSCDVELCPGPNVMSDFYNSTLQGIENCSPEH